MVAAMTFTSVAIVLILVGSSIDYETCHPVATYNPIKFQKFFLAFGAIMFSYGGHSAFPTIAHDMKIPSQFDRSVYLAYGSKSPIFTLMKQWDLKAQNFDICPKEWAKQQLSLINVSFH